MVATTTPIPNPAATRANVTRVLRCRSPVRARSTKVAKMTDGGGASRPLDQPIRTMNSHAAANVTGRTSPSAGPARRDHLVSGERCVGTPCAATAITTTTLRAYITIVDQTVERLLYIDARREHPRLLQRQTRLQNGIALWRANAIEGQLGAFLELNIDDFAGQLGHRHEDPLLVVVMGETIFACFLIHRDHPAGHIGILLEEVIAGVEDAPGIGLLTAIEQPRAVLHLRLRHHRIEAGPSVDVPANKRGLAVGMLEQHRCNVSFAEPDRPQRPHQKDMRIGAARDRHTPALEILNLVDRGVLACDQGGPLRAGIDINRLDRIAVDPADERRGACSGAEVDRSGIEEFERLV